MKKILSLILALIITVTTLNGITVSAVSLYNIALGCDYSFSHSPHSSYGDSGKELTDGIVGEAKYSDENWTAFNGVPEGTTVSVIVDLGAVKEFSAVEVAMLNDANAGVGYPTGNITVSYSESGKLFYTYNFASIPADAPKNSVYTLSMQKGTKKARYIKISFNAKSWAFLSEIMVYSSDILPDYSGSCSGITWGIYQGGILEINGEGEVCENCGFDEYKDIITELRIGEGITAIGDGVFHRFEFVKKVSLPSTLESIGEMAFARCFALRNITIPDSVTEIKNHAFYLCSSLEEITLSENLESISQGLFERCTSLVKVSIPESVTSIYANAFFSCSSLVSIGIPRNVSYIDEEFVFGKCESLGSIVVHFDNDYYEMCSEGIVDKATKVLVAGCRYTRIPKDGSVRIIGKGAFCGALCDYMHIPESVTEIRDNAFQQAALTEISLPNSLEKIGNDAFIGVELEYIYYNGTQEEWDNIVIGSGNEGLDNAQLIFSQMPIAVGDCGDIHWVLDVDNVLTVTGSGEICEDCGWQRTYSELIKSCVIGDGITGIGDYAFDGSCNLTDIEIPDTVVSIGRMAFCQCESLNEFTIPSQVTSVGVNPFYGCNLEKIEVESGNEVYRAVNNALIETTTKTLIVGCADTVVPDDGTVTAIGDCAFSYCKDLTELVIPDTVKSIGMNAFYESGIEELVIPEGVEILADGVFCYCENLKKVTLPSSITYIDNMVFYELPSLTAVYYKGTREDWSKITIKRYNEMLEDIRIYYDGEGAMLYGNVKAFGQGENDVKIELLRDGNVIKSTVISGTKGEYSFIDTDDGNYTLRVLKSKCATNEYEVTVSGADVRCDVEILLYGDVTGEGTLGNADIMHLNRYVNNMSSVFDNDTDKRKAYRLKAANVTSIAGTDTVVNNADVIQINRYLNNMSSVFDRLV